MALQLPVFIVLEVCVLFADLFPNGKPAVESMWTLYLHFTFFFDWLEHKPFSHMGDLEVY